MAVNVPWISQTALTGPLSKPQDGYNDIITSRTQQGAGRYSLTRLLLSLEHGQYFRQQKGEMRPELCADYYKAKSWHL